jgi:hypothetical protein
VTFIDRGPRRGPAALEAIDPGLAPYQVLGSPRMPG